MINVVYEKKIDAKLMYLSKEMTEKCYMGNLLLVNR